MVHFEIFQGPPPKVSYSEVDIAAPDLKCLAKPNVELPTFFHRCVKGYSTIDTLDDSFLINDKGSIHLSFTREEV